MATVGWQRSHSSAGRCAPVGVFRYCCALSGLGAGRRSKGSDCHLGAFAGAVQDELKRHGKKGLFDLGNAELILPVADDIQVPVRHRARYVSALNESRISTFRPQTESLAMARTPEELSKKFRYNQRRELRLLEEAGGTVRPVSEFSSAELASMYCDLFQRRWGFEATGARHKAEVIELLRELLIGSVVFLNDAPIAIQLVYRVEAPQWVSIEYVNGGVDPETRDFSPGSVLSFVNTQSAWENARALGKSLRFSFGRADREYRTDGATPFRCSRFESQATVAQAPSP